MLWLEDSCQAYSLSGKRNIDDPRANLFLEYFRAIEEIKPKIFVYENERFILIQKRQYISSITRKI